MNKKSELTISQALKIYTGSGLPSYILQFSLIMAVMYFSSLIVFVLAGAEKGFAAGYERVCKTPVSGLYFGGIECLTMVVFSFMTFEKNMPGGKFFRSVKGGFDTYKKMKTAQEMSTVISICLFTVIICAVNAVIPIIKNCVSTCVSSAVFVLLGMCIVNFMSIIKNNIVRYMIDTLLMAAIVNIGVLTIAISEGKIGIVQITAAVLTALLIPVSHKIMLSSYRKRRWNN